MTEPQDPLAQAPHLRPVRAQHPDVDIVVLPPEPDATDEPAPATPVELDAERDRVVGLLDRLLVAATTVPPPSAEPAVVPQSGPLWRSSPRSGHVVPVAEARVTVSGDSHARTIGRALGDWLHRDGWDCELRRTGPTVLLRAVREGRSVRLAWLDDTVLIAVRGHDLPVDPADARALVTGREDPR